MRVASDDVRLQMLEGLPGVSDLPGQVAELPADLCCWLGCTARSWSSLRTSVSILTFAITASITPDPVLMIFSASPGAVA